MEVLHKNLSRDRGDIEAKLIEQVARLQRIHTVKITD